ncbi:MAG: nucleotidyltransferase family protein [Gemmatimonadales bacterium]
MQFGPVHRFYDAVRGAAARVGLSNYIPELLLRFGLPGMMTRIGVDPPVKVDLSLLHAQKLYHSLVFEHAEALSAAFRARELPHFFAKGIALVGRVYKPGDRFFGDVDLYVPFEARDESVETLAQLGYGPLPETDQAGPPELRSALALEYVLGADIDRIGVDLHWTLDPVERLLPRRDRPIPQPIWDNVHVGETFNVPTPEHHAAILAHHLVHTDLLHVRSLLDLAFVFQEFADDGGHDFLATCDQFRLGRFGATLAIILDRDFGVSRPAAQRNSSAGNAFLRRLNLEDWLTIVARADPDDDSRITVGRIRRRLLILDHWPIRTLGADVLAPPASFLAWRWGLPLWRARLRHLGQLARKVTQWA